MKKVWITMLLLVLCLTMAVPAFAAEAAPRLVDQADLLSDTAESSLLSQLDEISAELKMDVVVVTTPSLWMQSAETYTDDLLDHSGYAEDTVLLLFSLGDMEWYIAGDGEAADIFTTERIDEIGGKVAPLLKSGEYAKAFDTYATQCQSTVKSARMKSHLIGIAVCVGIGLVIALIATGMMRSKLKSVHWKSDAADYVKAGSLNVTHRQDLFLYRQVQKREKPKPNSSGTHQSASGKTRSGGGGKL